MVTQGGNIGFWDWRHDADISAFFSPRVSQVKLDSLGIVPRNGNFDARAAALLFLHLKSPEKELQDWCRASHRDSILFVMSSDPATIGPVQGPREGPLVRRMRFAATVLVDIGPMEVDLTLEGELVARLIQAWSQQGPIDDLVRQIGFAAVADELLAVYLLALASHSHAMDHLKAAKTLEQPNWEAALQQFRERTIRGSQWEKEFASKDAQWPNAIFREDGNVERIKDVEMALAKALGVNFGELRPSA